MSILDRLSSIRGERDNAADIALAEDIARTKNKAAIKELVEHIGDKNRRLQSDCIKTLYEVGERLPELIAPYTDEFAGLLTSKNQRLVWGAMCALDGCASVKPERVHAHLKSILKATDGESVIARDHAVSILTKLIQNKYGRECFPILLDLVRTCPVNQFPSYAEKAAEVAEAENRVALIKTITKRLPDVEDQKAKKVRIEKVLKRLQ